MGSKLGDGEVCLSGGILIFPNDFALFFADVLAFGAALAINSCL